MAAKRSKVIIAYNGIDGACAAAMALLRFSEASVVISSARSIAHTLGTLQGERNVPGEVHVCGLGVYCDWQEAADAAMALHAKGAMITWYCGRGYLNERREQFAQFCEPVFLDLASNTAAVCRHLHIGNQPRASFLLGLAKCDPGIELSDRERKDEDQFWTQLIAASYAEYAKYRDGNRYVATIHKLASGQTDKVDDDLVRIFRRSGLRYALQGSSAQLKTVREMIRKCAAVVDEPLLILGESGVGKEHVAHLLHERGRRATEPFLAVNCAMFAGNEGLANSALFGHSRGAFTGATDDRDGAFQVASGGVLLLDEVGELPLEVQAKLLRVLEDKKIVPEGADHPVLVDVQIIAATNRNLPAMIRDGQFRADLFHRLHVLRIKIPPLRERPEDIDAIINKTLEDLKQAGYSLSLTRQERDLLKGYDWPGNVRQLSAVLRRAAYLSLPVAEVLDEERQLGKLDRSEGQPRSADLLPRCVDDVRPAKEIQREYAAVALRLYNGNLQATARALGIAVNTLRSWLAPL